MPLDVIDTLKQLVGIPSVNPMGRPIRPDTDLEGRLTEHLESLFQHLGLATTRQRVEPGRENLLARLDGSVPPERGGELLLWDAHQDTMPADGMTVEPWEASIRDGRLYGRGACDVKGGMAAMIAALARLAEQRPPDAPTIVLACTINEEYGFTGATAVARLWSDESSRNAILPRRPDACVVAEPTDLNVVVAHRGVVRWRCQTVGRAAHSSQPQRGSNAIYKMARVVVALQQYAQDVVPHLAQHALCGRPTLSVGTIVGGVTVNTVPERCTVEIDRRLVPGEQPSDAYQHAIDFLAAIPNTEAVHEPPYMQSAGLTDAANGAVAVRLQQLASAVGVECRSVGVPYGTNATAYAEAGVPTVVFGPGSIEQAHTADEWICLDQLQSASELLYQLGRSAVR